MKECWTRKHHMHIWKAALLWNEEGAAEEANCRSKSLSPGSAGFPSLPVFMKCFAVGLLFWFYDPPFNRLGSAS